MGIKIEVKKKGKSKHKKGGKTEAPPDTLLLALNAASSAYTKAIFSALAEDAKGNVEAGKYLEAAYQRFVAGGGTDGGNVTKGIGEDPEPSGGN